MATDSWKNHSMRTNGSQDYGISDHYLSNGVHVRHRETGVIEKLCQSYGFIECAEQDLRVFFHYSQYKGHSSELELGDCVEFEVTSDSRKGKPIACRVVKLEQGSVTFEEKSEKRVVGKVEVEARLSRHSYPKQQLFRNGESECGRVSYKVNGGFVSALKDGYSFIQCCDRDTRLFFHFSELNDAEQEINFSGEVEFSVVEDHVSGRLNAIRVRILPRGNITLQEKVLKPQRLDVVCSLKCYSCTYCMWVKSHVIYTSDFRST